MNKIGLLFEKPIDRLIEEVIKVDQIDEQVVTREIGEYVVTESIRSQFAEVYKEIAEGPSAPREGIGIWISGFFGSGKSSFAKILGYTVANKKIGNSTASALFKRVANDTRISDLLDSINTRIPFDAVIFDVSMDRGVRIGSERLTEIMYRALLRELGYAEDFDLAELEIALEADKKLADFEKLFESEYRQPWRKRRQLQIAINEASTILHQMDAKTYPNADSWATAIGRGRADIDPNKLARRAFELVDRRRSGRALIFIMDEVGQFVSRSVDKMLELQAIVQAFGVEGRNRTEHRQSVSPFWIVVTSQEKLNEVVTALDSRKIELARLQDRFRILVDLKQADIAEVTARRVLSKKEEAKKALGKIYDENAGRIKECCTLERTARNLDIIRNEFIRLYPYLPYQIDLCIDIVAGLRLKRGAFQHIGGSNRTIIKQSQQMMINDRTRLADEPVGTLVTLDKVYELLEAGNLLPSEVSQEINHVSTRLANKPLALKVVKAISLLEAVKDLPRTPHNIAVVLHPSVTSAPLRKEIEAALAELEKAQFVRNTEEGYKLLTVQEKNWETQRSGLEPRQADRHRIHREVVAEIFSEPKLRTHNYKNMQRFNIGITLDGESIEGDGAVMFNFRMAEMAEIKDSSQEARNDSAANTKEIYWVVPISDQIRLLVTELYRSREMIAEYERIAAQQQLTGEEAACLAEEKSRRDRYQRQLRDAITGAIEAGTTFFGGVSNEAVTLGSDLSQKIHTLFEKAVPVLYPKLEIGTLPLGGGEVEKFLNATNLSGLPKVFYGEKSETSLVIKEGGQFVPNTSNTLCRELLEYLRREHEYGNKVTGKMLETHFGGAGFGWDLEVIRLGIAVLFRGGAVELSHQGRKYSDYKEPLSRQPFLSNPSFRAASFSPREALDRKILANAARMYEEITGRDVNIEESAIARAFKEIAAAEREKLMPLHARLNALKLPEAGLVREHLTSVEEILQSASDDCVKTLASEGRTYLENHRIAEELSRVLTDDNIAAIRSAQHILEEQWPLVQSRAADSSLQTAANELAKILNSDNCLRQIEKIKSYSQEIHTAYRQIYATAFEKRSRAFTEALEMIKGRPEWLVISQNPDVTAEQKEALLQPLTSRAGMDMDLPMGATVCRKTGATLPQLESDLVAADSIAGGVLKRLMEISAPAQKIERISVSKLYPSRITNQQELEEFLSVLKQRLEKILASGSTAFLE